MKEKNSKGMGTISALLTIFIFIAVLTAAYIALTKSGIEDIKEPAMPEIQENIPEKAVEAEESEKEFVCLYEECDYFDKCDGEIIPSPKEDICCKGKCILPTDEEAVGISKFLYS